MAGSPEAQRRQKWRERRMLRRFRDEQPDTHAAWWADTAREWEQKEQGGGEVSRRGAASGRA